MLRARVVAREQGGEVREARVGRASMASGGGAGSAAAAVLRGGAPARKQFEPPTQWPEPEFEVQQPEFSPTHAQLAAQDLLVLRSREFQSRMKHHYLRLRLPEKQKEVMTYQESVKDHTTGCTTLPQNLPEALSHLYFPVELYEALVPERDRQGRIVGLANNVAASQFKKRTTPSSKTFQRLQQLESTTDPSRLEARERKNSIASDDEEDFELEEEDDEDGDYGINHYEDDEDEDMGGDEDDEATM